MLVLALVGSVFSYVAADDVETKTTETETTVVEKESTEVAK